MSVSDRRVRHRVNLRREILDAASKMFVVEGYERVTMRRVAEKIDYSPTTIYLHFKDKRELFAAICDETFSQLSTKLERLKTTPSTPIGLLREGLRTYIDFATSHPNHYAVTFLTIQEPRADSVFEASAGARAFGFLRDAVQACASAGAIRTDSVETTAQSLWASVHGLASVFITMKGFPFVPRQTLVDHTLDALFAGLQPPAAASRPEGNRQAARLSFLD